MSIRNPRRALPGNRKGNEPRRLGTFEVLEDRRLLTTSGDSTSTIPITPIDLVAFQPHVPAQRNLFNYNGYLTGPSNSSPVAIADNYLRSHVADLGILATDLDNRLITTNYVTQATGATTLTFQQTLHGLSVANANYNITVAADGSLLSVAGGFISGLSQRPISAPMATIGASQAIIAAATALNVSLSGVPTLVGTQNGSDSYTADISLDAISPNLRYVAAPGDAVQLAWNLYVRTTDSQHWYSMDVDAGNGALLGAIDFGNGASYEVFDFPSRSPSDGDRSVVIDPNIVTPTPATVPSPFGWHDTNGAAGAEFTITRGNNVNAYTDTDANDQVDAGSQPDGGASLDFTGALVPLDLTQEPSTYRAAGVANLFYWNNIAHDLFYLYGFDEAARNFQVNNYDRGGLGSDAVNAESQDGSGTNNANFFTPPDGFEPRMQMFVFTVTSPARSSDLDSEIVVHEYGHGVSNRLTGNSSGLFALQSRGMGEGWSDFFALMFTQISAAETTTGRGIATYSIGEPADGLGIRDFRYDFDIADLALESFLHYGTGPNQSVQVHSAGTRWAAALWDINHLLIQKYGFESNFYNSTSDAGNVRAMHLVMNALKIQALNPTFIQARDAILMADQLLYGGANQFEIWSAFARRGLGATASTPESDSTSIITSFEIPPNLLGVISLGPDTSVVEGDSDFTNLVFSVTIAGGEESLTSSVAYATSNGTATAGSDYVAQSGVITFAPGDPRTQFITIQVIGDLDVESNETFNVQLSEPSSAVLARSLGVGTILNDDVDVTINDISILEGNTGTKNAVLNVTTIGDVNEVVTVHFATVDGTAEGGFDFVPTAGAVTINPGASSANVTIPIINDTFNEGTETFFVNLSQAINARIVKPSGSITIIDNDPLPAFYVNNAFITTNAAGVVGAVFTVALDNRSGRTVNVQYRTIDDTAIAGEDYTAQSGTLTFPRGTSSALVTVPIMTSDLYSGNERFFLELFNPTNAVIADARGEGHLIFGDPPPAEYVVDDGDAAFATNINGGWVNLTNLISYQFDYTYHTAGTGTNWVSWTFDDLPDGTYQVFTRWSHFSNRATNAPYTVFDGAASLGTVSVNQQVAPAGDQTGDVVWQKLGNFTIDSGTLRVRLTDAANGYVTADAVRLVAGTSISQAPEIDVAGFEHSISDGDVTPTFADATEFGAVGTLTNSLTHTFSIRNTGNAPLHLSSNPPVQISGVNAGDFTILSQPATTVAPGATTTFQIMFHPSATGLRQAMVSIASDDASESPYDFAIQGTGASPAGAAAPLTQLAANPLSPLDVNVDSLVSPLDLLIVFNALLQTNAPVENSVAAPMAAELIAAPSAALVEQRQYFVDVNGDGIVSPLDALLVVNHLLGQSSVTPSAAPADEEVAAPLASIASNLQVNADDAVAVGLAVQSTGTQEGASDVSSLAPAVVADAALVAFEADVDALMFEPEYASEEDMYDADEAFEMDELLAAVGL